MNRIFLKKFTAFVTALVMAVTFLPTSVFASWTKDANANWTYSQNGYKATGWKNIDNTWYYFDSNGIMQTGWEFVNGQWYYLNTSGAMKTGWLKDNNIWYYLDANGAMARNWRKVSNVWYHFNASGAMSTGFINSGDKVYFASNSGAMQTGVIQIDGKTYYFDDVNGDMKTGVVKLGNKNYTVNSDGSFATNSLPEASKAFDKDGNPVEIVTPAQPTTRPSYGGGASEESSTPDGFAVHFDLNYTGATNTPATQYIADGETATVPERPEREGFVFIGWYTDRTYSELFDFTAVVTKSYNLVARWVDITDTTDTDSDGLTDPLEEYYGTDKNKADTDGDGLNDYFEIKYSVTNPCLADTDGNGTTDADEDFDEDTLTNIEEQTHNSNPHSTDSDLDGLTDYDEINTYNTKPDIEDTDEDGLPDGDEIALGLDPLVQKTDGTTLDSERTFTQFLDEANISATLLSDENTAKPSLDMTTSGNIDSTTNISDADNDTLSANKAIVGEAISINSSLISAADESILRFDVSDAISTFSLSSGEENSKYLICRYEEDETDVAFKPMDTTYSDGILSTPINKDGTYFVLDTEAFLTNLGIDVLSVFDSPEPLMLMELEDESEGYIIPHASIEERKENGNINTESTPLMLSSLDELEEELSLMSAETIGAKAQADIVFLIDATGSMSDAIYNVARNVNTFADDLVNKYKINANFSVIEYQDITCDGLDSTIQHKNGSSSWWNAKNVDSFKKKINSITAKDGGDWAETPIDALAMANELVATSSTQKFFVLITDAPYKENNQYEIENMDEMIDILKENEINVSVITDNWDSRPDREDEIVSGYKKLYEQTSGVYGYIYNSEFHTTLDKIADMIDKDVNDGSWIILNNFETIKLKEAPTSDSTADTDDDGLKDIDELSYSKKTNMQEFITAYLEAVGLTYEEYIEKNGTIFIDVWYYDSRPDEEDTDKDGFIDSKDTRPLVWDVSYRDLVILSNVVYTNLKSGTILSNSKELKLKTDDGVVSNSNEMKGWKVAEAVYNPLTGFEAAAYVKDDNIVIAMRGSESEDLADILQDWVVADIAGFISGLNWQLPAMETFVKNVVKKYGDSYDKFYVTGHSLGGYLALMAGSQLVWKGVKEKIERVVTFNGLGLSPSPISSILDVDDYHNLLIIRSKVKNYKILGDVVSMIGTTPGDDITRPMSESLGDYGIGKAHSLSSFAERFSNDLRKPSYSCVRKGLNDEK